METKLVRVHSGVFSASSSLRPSPKGTLGFGSEGSNGGLRVRRGEGSWLLPDPQTPPLSPVLTNFGSDPLTFSWKTVDFRTDLSLNFFFFFLCFFISFLSLFSFLFLFFLFFFLLFFLVFLVFLFYYFLPFFSKMFFHFFTLGVGRVFLFNVASHVAGRRPATLNKKTFF